MERREVTQKLKVNHKYRQIVERSDIDHLDNVNVKHVEVTGKIKDAVNCTTCSKLHILEDNPEEIKFLTIIGNLHADGGGGLMGSGNWDNSGVPVQHFCPECLIEEINRHVRRSKGDRMLSDDISLCELP